MENEYPKFLSNTPIGKDLFEGKSQERLADTVAGILKRDDFRVVGIDGNWGIGKSNLIQIVQGKLKTEGYHFFIYDAWGHQQDEQRRAILEELTEELTSKEILSNQKEWKNDLKKLLSKNKETTIKTKPVLSVGIIVSILAFVTTPILGIIAEKIDKIGWKTLFVAIPFLILLASYLIFLFKAVADKAKKRDTSVWTEALLQMFVIYQKDKIERTNIETISEDDPSVRKFRRWMDKMDSDLTNNKLVIVFDNLDRLPREDILSLWSSIHVFFAEQSYNRIKVIIPFDRSHIREAFGELNNANSNFTEDYINKTFDIVYRVSPPILSDWKGFFKNNWEKAFGDIDNEAYESVIQIYEIFNNNITPREIIVFINSLVSLKLLYGEKIPEKYFALFVLNSDTILKDPLVQISSPTYLEGASYLFRDEESLAKYITAIAYQLDPDNAIDFIYSRQLKNALVNKDFESFKSISESPFFATSILGVLSEIDNIQYPIETLDTVDSSSVSEHIMKLAWEQLYTKAGEIPESDFLPLQHFHLVLIKRLGQGKRGEWLDKVVSGYYNEQEFDPTKFANNIDEIDDYLGFNKIDIDVFSLLRPKNVSAEIFISFVSDRQDRFSKYKIRCDNGELNKLVCEYTVEDLEQARFLSYLKKDYNLSNIVKEIKKKIDENKSDKTRLDILFEKLKELTEDTIGVLIPDNIIATLFGQSKTNEEFYYDIVAMRLARLNNFQQAYSPSFVQILKSDNADVIDKVSERIEFYIDYGDYLIGSEHFTDSILYKFVARRIISDGKKDSRAEVYSLLENFEKICKNIEVDPQIFLNDLNQWDFENNKDKPIIDLPNYLFQEAVKNETDLARILVDNAIDYFEKLSIEKWVQIFDDLDSKAFALIKIISFNKWNSYSVEAIMESLKKIIQSGSMDHSDDWAYLFSSMEDAGVSLTNTFKYVRDKFYIDRDFMNRTFFVFFVPYFLKYAVLDDKPGDSFRTIFKVEFLDDSELLGILIKESSKIKALMQASNSSDVSEFKEGIRDRRDGSETISDLASKLDIRSKRVSKSD